MTKLKLLLALIAVTLPVMAKAERIATYVSVATFTVGGTGTNAYAFQNTSTSRDVVIVKINIAPISGGTVTSGPMNFWVMPSTTIVHGGTSQVYSGSYNSVGWTQPSGISASTGPVGVLYEGPRGAYGLPLAIIGVNPDETGTPVVNILENGLDLPVEDQGIVLPKNQSRGIVLQQKQFGATDWTAGVVMVKVTYILR